MVTKIFFWKEAITLTATKFLPCSAHGSFEQLENLPVKQHDKDAKKVSNEWDMPKGDTKEWKTAGEKACSS